MAIIVIMVQTYFGRVHAILHAPQLHQAATVNPFWSPQKSLPIQNVLLVLVLRSLEDRTVDSTHPHKVVGLEENCLVHP
jgi:hypothetical protein